MSAKGGRTAKVLYGSNVIAGIGDFKLSGFKATLLDDTEFGDTIATYKRAGIDNAGTISFSGNYDPDDTNGQDAISALKTVTSGLTNLYFYDQYGAGAAGTTYSFWRVASGGEIFLTDFDAIAMQKNGLGTISLAGQVSGAVMEHIS